MAFEHIVEFTMIYKDALIAAKRRKFIKPFLRNLEKYVKVGQIWLNMSI